MKKTRLLLAVAALFMLVGCASKEAASYDYYDGASYSKSESKIESKSSSSSNDLVIGNEPIYVKEYSVSVTVKDIDEDTKKIEEKVKEYSGKISYQSKSSSRNYITYTLKIPSGTAENFIKDLETLSKIENQTEYTTDVTDEYVTIVAKKSSIEAQIADLESLYKESTNESTKLSIITQKASLNLQLQEIETRLKIYQNEVAYSTISLYVYKEYEYSDDTIWDEIGEVIVESFRSLGEAAGYVLAFLLALIPYALALGVLFGLYCLVKLIVCKSKNKKFELFARAKKNHLINKARKEAYLKEQEAKYNIK